MLWVCMCTCVCSYILEEGKVDVNGPADRLTTIPILVRVCEESMLHYAGALLEAGANV